MQNDHFQSLITAALTNQCPPWPASVSENNTQLFIDYAQQHGVLGLLDKQYAQLQQAGWPAQILQAIAIANTAAKKIHTQRKKTIIQVFKAFSDNNIQALIFKGAANAYLVYQKPHHRHHADIDIMIPMDQFVNVKQILTEMGFVFDNTQPSKYGPSQSTAVLEQPNKAAINFDIHWKINNRLTISNTLKFDDLKRSAIPITQYGNDVMAFSYSDAILATCIHEAGSLQSEKGKLLSLYDVHLLMQIVR